MWGYKISNFKNDMICKINGSMQNVVGCPDVVNF